MTFSTCFRFANLYFLLLAAGLSPLALPKLMASELLESPISFKANRITEQTMVNQQLDGQSILEQCTGEALAILSYMPTSQKGGTVLMHPYGEFSYIPPTNFSGVDTFSYTIVDAYGNVATEKVKIAVISTGPKDLYYTLSATGAASFPSILHNHPYEGSNLSISTCNSRSSQGAVIVMDKTGAFTYVPEGFSGVDTFSFVVTDALGNKITTKVHLTVYPVGAGVHYATTQANGVLSGASLLADAKGKELTVISRDIVTEFFGCVTVYEDGSYKYLPPEGFTGVDGFNYVFSDGSGLTASGRAVITVLPNYSDSISVSSYETITSPLYSYGLGFGEKITPGEESLQIVRWNKTSIQGGKVSLDPANDTLSYTPPKKLSGSDIITIILADARGNETIKTIHVTKPNLQPPTLVQGFFVPNPTPKKTAVLRVSWKPSRSEDVAFYRIYYRNKIVRTIPADQPFTAQLILRRKISLRYFSMSAVSFSGVESNLITLHRKTLTMQEKKSHVSGKLSGVVLRSKKKKH
jgi:hypothetical protein